MLVHTPFNALTQQVIGAAIEVHRHLGPGLLESAYMPCLQFELASRRVEFVTQKLVPLVYKGLTLSASYRIDLLVEGAVVVEVKAVEALAQVHRAQVMTYMRLLGAPVGLLINFNVPKLVDGVKRVLITGDCDSTDDREASRQ
jgi:GxxExxY protein